MNKLNAILEDARTNAIELLNIADEEKDNYLVKLYAKELSTLEKHIDNSMPLTMDSLRHHLKDMSPGEMNYAWMCNIKWAMYDTLFPHVKGISIDALNQLCERSAENILRVLLRDDNDKAKG